MPDPKYYEYKGKIDRVLCHVNNKIDIYFKIDKKDIIVRDKLRYIACITCNDYTKEILNKTLKETLNKILKEILKETLKEIQDKTLNKTLKEILNKTLEEILNKTPKETQDKTLEEIQDKTLNKTLEEILNKTLNKISNKTLEETLKETLEEILKEIPSAKLCSLCDINNDYYLRISVPLNDNSSNGNNFLNIAQSLKPGVNLEVVFKSEGNTDSDNTAALITFTNDADAF